MTSFYKDIKQKDGLYNQCKDCREEYYNEKFLKIKKYYWDNRVLIKDFYLENRDRIKEYQ